MGEEDDFFNGDGNLSGKKRKDGAGKGVLDFVKDSAAAAQVMQQLPGLRM